MYVSVVTGLTAAFCWGTADYLSRRQSARVGYYRTVIYSHLVTLVVLIALIPVLSPNLELAQLPVLVLAAAGCLNFVAFIFLYRSFHTGVVSVVAPIAYTYPAVTAVLSVAILGAYISPFRVFAIAGIILGVVLLSTRFSELRNYFGGRGAPNMTAGVGSALGSSVFFGIVYIGIGYAAPSVSVEVPAMVLRAVGMIMGIILAPFLHQKIRPSRLAFSNTVIVMGVLEALGFLSFTYGILAPGGSLPVVAAISGMGGAVAAGYGLLFLRERLEPNQMLGVMLSLFGVFALLYLGG